MRTRATLLAALLAVLAIPGPGESQVHLTGEWRALAGTMPINPIHVGLLRTGRVLVVAGSENDSTNTLYRAAVWDPATGTSTVQTIPWDLFCNGMSWLPDGRALITGGNLQYNPFRGIRTTTVFDPATETFIQVQDMARGRWYPSNVALGDGRTATFGGWLETGGTNNAVELYTVGAGWSPQLFAPFTPSVYPWLHLLPDGRIFYAGASSESHVFNPGTGTWTLNVARMNYPRERLFGASVLLPLRAAEGYRARVMVMGGDSPLATDTAEVIDLSVPAPAWRSLPRMLAPRVQMDGVLLPNGKVLALGGSADNNTASTATLDAQIFDPVTETWAPAGRMARPRMYHSVALLLPDATVWAAGSNPVEGTWDNTMEVYRPPYLFTASGAPAPRPSITGAPAVAGYGASFTVGTPDAANIASVVLVRPGSNTHAFDFEQRLIELQFTASGSALSVTAPPNSHVAPPGYYMLFLLNRNGVPSVARFVQLSATPGNQPPRGTITNPAADVTISAGQSVTFAGSGSDGDGTIARHSWLFPGGSPAASTNATPGAVRFDQPGTYRVSLTVVDDLGANDPSPPTRLVTVQPATLTASFTTPSPGAVVSGTVSVGMAASGAGGASNRFTLRVGGATVFDSTVGGTTATYAWDTRTVADGAYTLSLTVRDSTGATATATRAVSVANAAPPGSLTVHITQPRPGDTVSGINWAVLWVEGAAAGAKTYTLSVPGGFSVGSETTTSTGPVSIPWDTTSVADGATTLTGSVRDSAGARGSTAVSVTVRNSAGPAPLTATFTSPAAGATVSGTVTVGMSVGGSTAASRTFRLSVDGAVVSTQTVTATTASFAWNTTTVTNGSHTLGLTVTDAAGRSGSTTRTVTVSNAAPAPLTAAFTSPAAGATVGGTVTVGMSVGGSTAASRTFRLSVDGAVVSTQTVTATTASFAWNTTTVANGSHTLGLTVTDAAGRSGSASRTVTVSNAAPPPPTGSLTVYITQPRPGETVRGINWAVLWVEGAAAGAKTYTLSVAGATVGGPQSTTSTGPVSIPWDTALVADGTRSLTGTVGDSSGKSGSVSINVVVSNGPAPAPLTAAFTSPAAGATVSGTVTVGMSVSGSTAASRTFGLSVDGAIVSTQTVTAATASFAWNTTAVANGSHTLGLTVTDAAGRSGSASRTVTVSNAAPPPPTGSLTVYITQPRPGETVRGINWAVLWVEGAAAGAKTYTLSVAGATVGGPQSTTSTGPVSIPWDTALVGNGTRTLTGTVRDSSGKSGAVSITVVVQNP